MKETWLFTALTGLSLIAAAPTAREQAPAATGPHKVYTSKTAFRLPLLVDERERASIKEVQLWVRIGAHGTWAMKDAVAPTQKEFVFHAPADGEYAFNVVTVDLAGNKKPADVSKLPPVLVVVVDREPPELDVHPVTAASGMTLLQCDVRDANADVSKTKLEYQAADKQWVSLEAVQMEPALYRIPDAVVGPSLFRATAVDRAGNRTTREVKLQPTSSVAQAPGSAAPVVPASAPSPVPPLPPEMPITPASFETKANKPAELPAPSATALARQFINSTKTQLNYQLESPVANGKVEVWMTRDEGKTWQRLAEDKLRNAPVAIDLPGEGAYGLTMVINTGGAGGPPAPGEAPDFHVEVDLTKPVAELGAMQSSADAEGRSLLITWTASDKNLKAEPISLSYATQPAGPWLPIAKSLKNDGHYRWKIPAEIRGFAYIQLEACDEAGNVTMCASAQPVALVPKTPKARITGLGSGAH